MRRWTLALAWALACAAGCGGKDQPPPAAAAGPKPAVVEVGAATPGPLDDTRSFLGHAKPVSEVVLAAGVSGRLISVVGRTGDRVQAGQVLVELERDLLAPALDALLAQEAQTRAELDQAKRELARVRTLQPPAVTEAERERYEARVKVLDAQRRSQAASVEQLRAELARHTVTAPFDGAVRARLAEPGGWVSPGTPLLELVSAGELEIEVSVSSDIEAQIELGQEVQIEGPTPTVARVAGVVPVLDPMGRTLLVRLTVDAPPAWLLGGAAVRVIFPFAQDAPGAVVVPRDALVRGPAGNRVIKVADGAGVPVPVRIVGAAGDRALVQGEGLSAGDSVVTRGNERLRPGQPIEVTSK
jgi:RND family efflux transporter MFP subunit